MKRILNHSFLSGILIGLSGIVLSFRNLKEPDLWWQLLTGEWMLENQSITTTDVFSYTHFGVEWINVKWAYEVLYAWLSQFGGPNVILLVQALVILCILLLLRSTLIHLRPDTKASSSVGWTLLAFLVVVSFRLNSRPEMFSHLLAATYLLLFVRSIKSTKWLWLIPVLQVAWTNLHEGYGIGVAMAAIFGFGTILEWRISKNTFNWTVLAPLALTIPAMAISPRGFQMITHPLNIFEQLGKNKFTTELYGIGASEYMDMAGIAAIVLGVILVIQSYKRFRNRDFVQAPIGITLVALSFLYLALKAHRNIPFFLIAVLPLIELNALKWIKSTRTKYYILITCLSALYICTVSNTFYKITGQNQHFGLSVAENQTPIGVAEFMKTNKIEGNGFTDYLSSSYLMWRLQPEFKSYIDLRDLDIYPAQFMENVLQSYVTPDVKLGSGESLWQFLDSLDKFDYVVLLNSKNFVNLSRHIATRDPNFELIYADPLSCLFVRRTKRNTALIQEFGFNNGRTNVFHGYTYFSNPRYTAALELVFNPWTQTSSLNSNELLRTQNIFYQNLGYPSVVNKFEVQD